jgi:predicted enzyme related to lactoylglutathione lyase
MLRCALACLVLASSLGAAAGPLGPDGVPGQAYPGKFVWVDLATEDPAAAQAFYGKVFGWRFKPAAGAPASYTLIEDATGKVGGMFRQARPAGAAVGSRWIALMSVRDPATAAAYVRRSGGEVLLAPTAVEGRGTHAVFRDPQGAVFGVLASSGGDPPDDPVEDGDIFWLDLFVPSAADAARFYAGLAGYSSVEAKTESGRTRWILATGDIARAGIVPLPSGRGGPGWLPYILVDDVKAAMSRARAAGGKVLAAPRADVLGGNLAVIADPLGGAIGLVNDVTRVEPPR